MAPISMPEHFPRMRRPTLDQEWPQSPQGDEGIAAQRGILGAVGFQRLLEPAEHFQADGQTPPPSETDQRG